MAHFSIDTRDLDKLQAAFKAAPRSVRREYRNELKAAGRIVADDARKRIAPYSPPTAESMKVGTRGVNKVVVSAGKGRRIATLLEVGDRRHRNPWRHPLFGDRKHWYDQETHPYLAPAWKAKKRKTAKLLSKAVRRGLRDVDIEAKET